MPDIQSENVTPATDEAPGLSAQARGFLDAISQMPSVPPDLPSVDDVDGWKAWIAGAEAGFRPNADAWQPAEGALIRDSFSLDGFTVHTLTPTGLVVDDQTPIFIDFHGGALVMCGGDLSWKMAAQAAVARPGITWAPDYRNPPEHPFPAAFRDALATYEAALAEQSPERIVVAGTSGGGNLAAALLLQIRERDLPVPAALVLMSPEVDLTESGDSFQVFADMPLSGSLMQFNLLYANGHDLRDPHVSPLFGDLSGFPPTFIYVGSRDFFLSNSARMHRKLLASGVHAELHVFEGQPHGGFGGLAPEDDEVRSAAREFERRFVG